MAGAATEATKTALFYYGPSLVTENYWDAFAKPKAAWLPRLQAAAKSGGTSTNSHVNGRALDIVLFASEPIERDYANRIVRVFVGLKAKIGFISIVYNDWEWNGQGAMFPHIDQEHKTHIHIEWGKTGVGNRSFASDLEDALYAEFSGGNLASGDYGMG